MIKDRKKIALVGASSTGKSTVFELLKARLPEYTFIDESTRTVRSYGFPINEQGTDLTQLAISTFHLQALLHPHSVIYDRCYMDLVAYSRHLPISEYILTFLEHTWVKKIQHEYDLYVYFPIEFHSVYDGVRSVNEEWRSKVDHEFKTLLHQVQVETTSKVITVQGSPKHRMQEILDYISNL